MADVPEQPKRDALGRLLPGHTANPLGRPALPADLRQKHAKRSLERIVELMESKDETIALKAAQWIAERVYGKAAPVLEDGEGGREIEPVVAVLLTRAKRGAAWEDAIEGELAGDDESGA